MHRRLSGACLSILLAVAVLSLALSAAPARAGDSPGTARALSVLLPGAGHFYAGEGLRGFEVLSVFAGAVTTAIAIGPGTWVDKQEDSNFPELSEGTSTTTKLFFYGASAVAVGTWLYGVIDAPKAVRRQLALVPEVGIDRVQLALRITF